jgi:hypothetical protein
MSWRHALACMAILALCGVLSGCGPRGFQSPRDAAVDWSRALLNGDYATLESLPMASVNAAQLAATREQLGLPADPTNVEVVVLDELDHDDCALVDIVYRRTGQDLSSHIPVVALSTEAGWWASGIPHAATSTEKLLIDPVVTQYLKVLASPELTSGVFPLGPQAPTKNRATMRGAAFGRFASTGLSGFRVESVTGQLVSPYVWFATANVTATQGGQPVSFAVELWGTMTDELDGAGVTGGTLGALFR